MENPEILAALGTRDTEQRQTKQKTQHRNIMINMDATNKLRVNSGARDW